MSTAGHGRVAVASYKQTSYIKTQQLTAVVFVLQVTGANKGIGYGIVRELAAKFDGVVYLTSRDEGRGRKAVEELGKLGLHPEYHQLDIDDESSVLRLRDFLVAKHGGLDVLV